MLDRFQMIGMAASKSVRRAEPIASETVRRAERFCLRSSPPTIICLACLMRVLNVKRCV